LEVQNIDEILPPPPEPQPLDPAIENARALMGEMLTTFPDQNQDAHIRMHIMFMKTPLVATSASVMGTLYAHIMEHISQKARKMVNEEIAGIMTQVQQGVESGTIDPVSAQQQIQQVQQDMQDPAQVELLMAVQMEKLMSEVLPQIVPESNSPMDDPLVQIRMKELALKEQDLQRKKEDDQGEMLIELQRLQQRAATDAARIESQEEIADERNVVNRERIDVQRERVKG
jgi:hypothetical protein